MTIVDKASHNEIVSCLDQTNIPVFSEEGTSIDYNERKHWDIFWLVDPLDGTKEFIKKNGEFTVNIALITEGKSVMGIIYVPVTQFFYVGIEGEGAWKMEVVDEDLTFDLMNRQGVKLPQNSLHSV